MYECVFIPHCVSECVCDMRVLLSKFFVAFVFVLLLSYSLIYFQYFIHTLPPSPPSPLKLSKIRYFWTHHPFSIVCTTMTSVCVRVCLLCRYLIIFLLLLFAPLINRIFDIFKWYQMFGVEWDTTNVYIFSLFFFCCFNSLFLSHLPMSAVCCIR